MRLQSTPLRLALVVLALGNLVVVSRWIKELWPSLACSNADLVQSASKHGAKRPSGLRLAFVGDSLTRYQYLSLVYYLRHGQWDEDGNYPNMAAEMPFQRDWSSFYMYTNTILHPWEWCDCFRNNPLNVSVMCENRYYMDAEHDNYVYMMMK
jgi:hypothetical protein